MRETSPHRVRWPVKSTSMDALVMSAQPSGETATQHNHERDHCRARRGADDHVHLPFGVGERDVTGLLCAVVSMGAAAVGWWFTGRRRRPAARPRRWRSPWRRRSRTSAPAGSPTAWSSPASSIVACSWGFVATLDNRMMGPLAVDLLAGLVLGGAPVVFLVWLVAPRLIGGGDWKLLVVLGAMVGFARAGGRQRRSRWWRSAPPRSSPSTRRRRRRSVSGRSSSAGTSWPSPPPSPSPNCSATGYVGSAVG